MTLPESRFAEYIASRLPPDPAHDLQHVRRVVECARRFATAEGAELAIVIPAAWLHDCVSLPKNHPERHLGSRLAAQEASRFLHSIDYPEALRPAIAHAIEAHSFSAAIPARTLEAQVVQDADRIDGLGAIGISRCLLVGGVLQRPLYSADDPFCDEREPDDQAFCVDHFYRMLFRVAETLHTPAARNEAAERVAFMRAYLTQLEREMR